MDLIDREALKKEAFKVSDCVFEDELNEMVVSIKSIDNAPKIETFTFDDMNKAQEVGYKAGKLEGKSERPHGKWLRKGDSKWHCSECGAVPEFGGTTNTDKFDVTMSNKYCRLCGADMREANDET